jgi:antitoxin CptB
MLELDLLLARYLEHRYPVAPASEQRAFEALIELQDPQLLAFLMGWDLPVDPELMHVVARCTRPDP